jgi:hypothetical protein
VVEVLESIYKKGVCIGKKGIQSIADWITRHLLLQKYYRLSEINFPKPLKNRNKTPLKYIHLQSL